MTKGWSVDLLAALVFFLISRWALHAGGFWDSRFLRWIEDESPLIAVLFGIASIRPRQEWLASADLTGPSRAVLVVFAGVVRLSLLLVAVFFAVGGILALATAFFGVPFPP